MFLIALLRGPLRALRPWWGRRSLRARTLLVGGALTLVLVVLGASIPIPYLALGPGSTYNTIGDVDGQPVITFAGSDIPPAASQPTSGNLNMLTVTEIDHLPMFEALGLWLSGRYQMAPREEYYPPGQSTQQVQQQNLQEFQNSQSAAASEALQYLGYQTAVYVGDIPVNSPAANKLNSNDQILAVNGHQIALGGYTAVGEAVQQAMSTTRPGQQIAVTVQRGSAQLTEHVTLISAAADAKLSTEFQNVTGSQGFLGISLVLQPKAPFTISVTRSLDQIGGPSAGLMFTLGMIDKLSGQNLTGGRFIAGTGTITYPTGAVGAIGGVTLKEIAARDAGATVMLVPAANCSEADTAIPAGLHLVKVSTLDDAVTALRTLKAGGTPPAC